jgi:hypothetical protein
LNRPHEFSSFFWPSKTCVIPTSVISSLSPPRCRLSSDRRRHTATPCHASFPWIQNELYASTSSFSNALFHRPPSRTETEALNPYHRYRSLSPDSPTPTLHSYKKDISTLVTLPTTQLLLHFTSSLARTPRHWNSMCHRHSLSLPSHAHRPTAQRHPR